MKHTIDLFAEVVSLPFSSLFLSTDPFVGVMEKSKFCNHRVLSKTRIHDFDKRLKDVAVKMAGELNRHIEIGNLSELEYLLKRTFNAKAILDFMNQYEDVQDVQAVLYMFYFQLLREVSSSMLTNRDGIAMLRPWHGSYQAHFPFVREDYEAEIEKSRSFSPQRIELWNSLLKCMPEDLFLSCYAATLVEKTESAVERRNNSFKIIKSFGDSVRIADELLDRILDHGMAETHMHAGNSKSFGLVWEDMLSTALHEPYRRNQRRYEIPYKESIEQAHVQVLTLECAVVRLFLAAYLQSNFEDLTDYLISQPLSERYQRHFQCIIVEIYKNGHANEWLSEKYISDIPFFSWYSSRDGIDVWRILGIDESLRNAFPTLVEHCFLCWSILHIQEEPRDVYFMALFMYYLRIRSFVYRCHVQDSKNTGLAYFQKYYRVSCGMGSQGAIKNLERIFFTALKDIRVEKTEFRFAPPFCEGTTIKNVTNEIEIAMKKDLIRFIRQHLFSIILHYRTIYTSNLEEDYEKLWRNTIRRIREGQSGALLHLLDNLGVSIGEVQRHRFGIVYHLIKSGEEREEPSCFAKMHRAPDVEKYKHFSFGSARFSYECSINAISNLRDLCPEMSRLIVGIDAASMEIPTEPWVFSPAFHIARQRNSTLCYEKQVAADKSLLGLTYHVGEDFNHPLSGLRHIDEAINWLGMHAGDRLGHAMALGIELERWFQTHRLVVLPRVEWMENNLWLWRLLSSEAELAEVACYVKIIETQIMESAKNIYGTTNGITIENLYQVYDGKADSIENMIDRTQRIINQCSDRKDCFKEVDGAKLFPCWNLDDKEKQSWSVEALELSHHCMLYKQKMNEVIMIPDNDGYIQISKCLQKYLRKKASRIGLVIEANPSSNAVIGEIDGVLMHPVWQFRQIDGCPVMTSVNTDDPLLFNASIANEHAHVYYALRYHGMNVEDALKEVDTMRGIGMQTSFIRASPPFTELLSDYEQIIRAITL